jgi:aspartyl-tRNA synthetase
MRQPPKANGFRDTWTGDLRGADAGREVRVAGWVHRRRDHGGLIFIDVRDRSGIVQLVFHPDTSGAAFAAAERLRSEHVISALGTVVEREPQNKNPNIPTGDIEISVTAMDTLAEAVTPPFPVDEDVEVDETLRLTNRAVDLRRDVMQRTLELRHAIVKTSATSSRSRRRSSRARRPRALVTSWCPRGCSPVAGTRCRSRRSCSNSC